MSVNFFLLCYKWSSMFTTAWEELNVASGLCYSTEFLLHGSCVLYCIFVIGVAAEKKSHKEKRGSSDIGVCNLQISVLRNSICVIYWDVI